MRTLTCGVESRKSSSGLRRTRPDDKHASNRRSSISEQATAPAPQLAAVVAEATLGLPSPAAAIRSSLPAPHASVPIVARLDTSRPIKSMHTPIPCPPFRHAFSWWREHDKSFLGSVEASAQARRSRKKRRSVLSTVLYEATRQEERKEKEKQRLGTQEEKERTKEKRLEKRRNTPLMKAAPCNESYERKRELAMLKLQLRSEEASQEKEMKRSSQAAA